MTTINPLRPMRIARGVSLREVSRRTGISPSQLSKIERGQAGLTLPRLYLIAKEIGLKPLAEQLRPFIAQPEESRNGGAT